MSISDCKYHLTRTEVAISRKNYLVKMQVDKKVIKCLACGGYYLT